MWVWHTHILIFIHVHIWLKSLYSLNLELLAVVSHLTEVLEIELRSSRRTSALNCQAVSPTLIFLVLITQPSTVTGSTFCLKSCLLDKLQDSNLSHDCIPAPEFTCRAEPLKICFPRTWSFWTILVHKHHLLFTVFQVGSSFYHLEIKMTTINKARTALSDKSS